MPSRRSSSANGNVEALDFDRNRKPVRSNNTSRSSTPQGLLRDDESLLSNVVDGIVDKDRRRMAKQTLRYLSYASGILSRLVPSRSKCSTSSIF